MANMEALSVTRNRWQQCPGAEVNELLRRLFRDAMMKNMGKLKMLARAQAPISESNNHPQKFMAVSIRLRREGALNRPYYKVVVADQRSPRDGKFIEIIGNYDPKKTGSNANIDLTRAEYWISKGAQPSETVRSLIKKARKTAVVEK
jgi:small subunit ribosomal protein S16